MDLTTEYLDTHEARLTVVVDEATLKEAQNKTARALSKRMHIPGFRPGHAPTAMVIRAIGGPQAFALEVADTLAREIYPKVLDQAQVNPYGPGKIEDVQQDPFRIVFRVPLQPKVDLKDYRSIRLPYPSVSVTEEDIQRELMALREEHAIVETVERPAQFGDMVEADIFLVSEAEQAEQASAVEAEEEEPTKFQSADEPFVLNPEETSPLMRQIIEAVVGMSAGEEKTITAVIQYTTSDPPQSDEFKLRIALRRVSSRTLPEISDELAQTVGSFTTLAELREDIRRRLLERRQSAAESAYTDQVVQAFAELAEVKMPPDLIEDRLNEAMNTYKDIVKRKAGLPFEEWLKLKRQTEDEVREELRQDVIQRLRRGLVMREVAAAEQLTVTPEEREQEIERRIAQYLAMTSLTEEQLRRLLHRPEQIEDIVNEMLSQKVIDRMVAIARGEAEAQPSPEQAAPEPASAG